MSVRRLVFLVVFVVESCSPTSEPPAEAELVLEVAADGSVWAEGAQRYAGGDDLRPFRTWLYERSLAMPRGPKELANNDLRAALVLVRAAADAPFSAVLAAGETCRFKGIGIWKIDYAVAGDGEEPSHRVSKHYPMEIGIRCTPGPTVEHLVLLGPESGKPVVLVWSDSVRQEELEAARVATPEQLRLLGRSEADSFEGERAARVTIDASAASLADLPAAALDIDWVDLIAPSETPWREVFTLLRSLSERGIETFEWTAR